MSLALSVLDLAPVVEGVPASESVRRTVELARHAEALGYRRVWYAEHHAMASVASSAPEILIAHSAAATRHIHLGAGGVMLPNHAPLRIAETYQTLSALYPDRIDLGLGRAPGGVSGASRALRAAPGEQFPLMIEELQALSRGINPGRADELRAEPRGVALPPIWLLGSSGASAQLAGRWGMGYSFAAHFSQTPPGPAMRAYREAFQPSPDFALPHAILGVAAICAETEDAARRLAATMELLWVRLQRGEFAPLPSPETALSYPYSEWDQHALRDIRARTIVGTPEQVRRGIETLAAETLADEVMIVANIHDHAARLHSYELIGKAFA